MSDNAVFSVKNHLSFVVACVYWAQVHYKYL